MVINKFLLSRINNTQLDKVGEILKSGNKGSEEYIYAIDKINEYRKLFDNPLMSLNNFIRNRISRNKKLGKNFKYIIAQRLKRLESIIGKLKNESKGTQSMKLSQMQDVGGIRLIVNSISDIYILKEIFSNLDKNIHQLKSIKDYIFKPSIDGYRGVHLIYKYGHKENIYNGLLIEIQIRTQLQHIRAMAVETFTMFSSEGIKFRQGSQEIRDYFELVADGFALLENGNISDARKNLKKEDIYIQIINETGRLDIIPKLVGFGEIFKITKGKDIKGTKEYILQINKKTNNIMVKPYNESLFEEFAKTEQDEDIISVIVSTKDMKELRKAYPSYYADTKEFIITLMEMNSLIAQKQKSQKISLI